MPHYVEEPEHLLTYEEFVHSRHPFVPVHGHETEHLTHGDDHSTDEWERSHYDREAELAHEDRRWEERVHHESRKDFDDEE